MLYFNVWCHIFYETLLIYPFLIANVNFAGLNAEFLDKLECKDEKLSM
ncbi:hypothetical protein KT99_15582 [Shewanella benthica KT99]|uniref:Uncharacterized protein n=1 Tax=Shewanella benthica KT99 TaxID=314608 RepID=A9D9W9_9GAMM|nr:hypothetical protein KT99_15582 [Shewanella benthica KT99]